MPLHANAPLSVAGRYRLVMLIEAGCSQRQAARRLGVAPATANRWYRRWRAADARARDAQLCLQDRSSAPHRCPRQLSAAQEAPILRARSLTNLGPARLSHIVGVAASTIWKVLARNGRSRVRQAPRPIYRRYEWAVPGALIHLDTAKLARFGTPGHRTRGRGVNHGATSGLGHLVIHVAVDDCSRYAYVEQHTDENAVTCARFLRRALAHFAELGCPPAQAIMTDQARNYRTAHAFQDVIAGHGLRHILTPPYTPRVNGNAERFIQTLKREWAYAHEWPSSQARSRALGSWLRTYNRRRLHSSLGNRPPISRVHNLCG